jgi:MFS family permease
MSQPLHDPYHALRFHDFRLVLLDDIVRSLGGQMMTVALGWEIYDRTHAALALGLVGLVQFLPLLVLAPLAGHLADRLKRTDIIILAQLVGVLTSLGLAAVSYWHGSLVTLYGCLLVMGMGEAFHDPAAHALPANMIPAAVFENAASWLNSVGQLASIVGPVVGGLIVATRGGATVAYLLNAVAGATCILVISGIQASPPWHPALDQTEAGQARRGALREGMRFVWRTPVLFAAFSLDLFAVLFGGVETLLPVFAQDLLRVGPTGLGYLQAAPAVGALGMALFLAHRPRLQHAGLVFLAAVAGCGLVMIGFGLSRVFWLSLLLLGLFGALDTISMVVREVLMLTSTPDAMRGRVAAIEGVFTSSSNQLGGLESGVTTQLFGPVVSVVGGGIATIVVVLMIAGLSPTLRQLRTFLAVEHSGQQPAHEDYG